MQRLFKRPQWFRSKATSQDQKRPYIVPTGFGFVFGTLALVQLIMAITAQNNLIYLFVFTEVSIALASMFFSNSNIHRAQLASMEAMTCFANEESWVEIQLKNTKPSYQLYLKWSFQKNGSYPLLPSSHQIQIPWTPRRRGLQALPKLVIESTFPFGLLRCWKVIRSKKEVLVLPERKGNASYPSSTRGDSTVDQLGLFHDIRKFQRGDWPRRIDWRASQRSQQMMIRRYEEESAVQLDFSWEQTAHLKDIEERISQLALWIDIAERQGAHYSLRVGSWNSGRYRGPQHWQKCFEFLALIDESGLR